MVREYRKSQKRLQYVEGQMHQAIKRVLDNGKAIKSTARDFVVPRSTLSKKVNILKSGGSLSLDRPYTGGFKPVFDAVQEEALKNYVLEMESLLMGLTIKEIRRLAYDFAVKLKIKHPFSKKNGCAGKDWVKSFMKRHSLTSRKPEHTSADRANGFNKQSVEQFFNLLQEVYAKHNFQPENIYNCDETGLTVIPKSVSRVIALKGRKQVGGLKAAERGETVSAEICMSAAGVYMPPMLIFPRKRENPEFLQNKPPGAWAVFEPKGWMTNNIFVQWLKKFIEFSRPSATNPVLLILDGHGSHVKNLEVINLARDANLTILCLPPHCSNKLQPLDVAFMKPLSNYYTEAVNAFQRKDKGQRVTIKYIFGLFGIAFAKAAKMDTAMSAFKKCGIVPLNPNVFTDTDFAASQRSNYDLAIENNNASDVSPDNVHESSDSSALGNLEEASSLTIMHDGSTSELALVPAKNFTPIVSQLSNEPVSSSSLLHTPQSLSTAYHDDSSISELALVPARGLPSLASELPNVPITRSSVLSAPQSSSAQQTSSSIDTAKDLPTSRTSLSLAAANTSCTKTSSSAQSIAVSSGNLSSNMKKAPSVSLTTEIDQAQVSNFKRLLNNISQSHACDLVPFDSSKKINSVSTVSDSIVSEPCVSIPLSYIKNAQPFINALSSILAQPEVQAQNNVSNSCTLQNLSNNPSNKKSAPKKRKTGQTAIITDDGYKESLEKDVMAAALKKTKKEGVKKNVPKPIIRSVEYLGKGPVYKTSTQTNAGLLQQSNIPSPCLQGPRVPVRFTQAAAQVPPLIPQTTVSSNFLQIPSAQVRSSSFTAPTSFIAPQTNVPSLPLQVPVQCLPAAAQASPSTKDTNLSLSALKLPKIPAKDVTTLALHSSSSQQTTLSSAAPELLCVQQSALPLQNLQFKQKQIPVRPQTHLRNITNAASLGNPLLVKASDSRKDNVQVIHKAKTANLGNGSSSNKVKIISTVN